MQSASIMTKTVFESDSLGQLIELLMEERGFTSREALGDAIGLSKGTIKNWLDATTPPSPDKLDLLAAYIPAPRRWIYDLAYTLSDRPNSAAVRRASAIRELLETAPEDIQEAVLAAARAMIANRSAQQKKKDVDEELS